MDEKLWVPRNPRLPQWIGFFLFAGPGLACLYFGHWIAFLILAGIGTLALITKVTVWELDRSAGRLFRLELTALSEPRQGRFNASYPVAEIAEVLVLDRWVQDSDSTTKQTVVHLVLRSQERVQISRAARDGRRMAELLGVPMQRREYTQEDTAQAAAALGELREIGGMMREAANAALHGENPGSWQPSQRLLASLEAQVARTPDSALAHERLASLLLSGASQPAKAQAVLERAQALYTAQARHDDAAQLGQALSLLTTYMSQSNAADSGAQAQLDSCRKLLTDRLRQRNTATPG